MGEKSFASGPNGSIPFCLFHYCSCPLILLLFFPMPAAEASAQRGMQEHHHKPKVRHGEEERFAQRPRRRRRSRSQFLPPFDLGPCDCSWPNHKAQWCYPLLTTSTGGARERACNAFFFEEGKKCCRAMVQNERPSFFERYMHIPSSSPFLYSPV